MCFLKFVWLTFQSGGQDQERKHKKRRGEFYSIQTSLIVAALKKMLPIGLNMCTPGDQELISLAKTRYLMVRTHVHGWRSNTKLDIRYWAQIGCRWSWKFILTEKQRNENKFTEAVQMDWETLSCFLSRFLLHNTLFSSSLLSDSFGNLSIYKLFLDRSYFSNILMRSGMWMTLFTQIFSFLFHCCCYFPWSFINTAHFLFYMFVIESCFLSLSNRKTQMKRWKTIYIRICTFEKGYADLNKASVLQILLVTWAHAGYFVWLTCVN